MSSPAGGPLQLRDIFCIPVFDKRLIYAPLHETVALVDERAASLVRGALAPPFEPVVDGRLAELVDRFAAPGQPAPRRREGELDPLFLGLIPTRGCNMACPYCDFAAPSRLHSGMSNRKARWAIDAYLRLVSDSRQGTANIQFFGGEPFFAAPLVHFAVGYARLRAREFGLTCRFEATTNGFYGERQCRWIADQFDAIVLSLDGCAEVQDRQRPTAGGRGSFETVVRNARILSESNVDLMVRACVTADSVHRMHPFAEWICSELRPYAVCFEPMTACAPASEAPAGLEPPDPWRFAESFLAASRLLEAHGIEAVLSTADIRSRQQSFCPVGKDALIVSPDGAVDACYQLEHDWREKGLDLRLGSLLGPAEDPRAGNLGCPQAEATFDLDSTAIERVRGLEVDRRPLCAECLCRYHCAGGCHIHHDTSGPAGSFDDLCIYTRLVTVARLLDSLDESELADAWLRDMRGRDHPLWAQSDRLLPAVPDTSLARAPKAVGPASVRGTRS